MTRTFVIAVPGLPHPRRGHRRGGDRYRGLDRRRRLHRFAWAARLQFKLSIWRDPDTAKDIIRAAHCQFDKYDYRDCVGRRLRRFFRSKVRATGPAVRRIAVRCCFPPLPPALIAERTPAASPSGTRAASFYDLVGGREQCWRNRKAEGFGGFQIDQELELGRLEVNEIIPFLPFSRKK